MNGEPETIAAVATPPGRGGVGIVRVSGPGAPEMAERLLGHVPQPRQAEYLPFRDPGGEPIDEGIALFFPAPHSFTGENVLELQGHGGPVVMDLLLEALISLGARPARPGEFSERAFLNGKLDLAQAEAIADLIDSASVQAARSALHSLQGAFSNEVHRLVQELTELRVYVEAAIDFTDEEVDFLAEGRIAARITELRKTLANVRASARQGALLREGMTLVIAGRPNAGKSSLLNRLSGRDSAIVTEIPGTTRDLLREQVDLDGMPLHIIDTAGLRESADVVEQEGIRRAWQEIAQADRLLLVVDDTSGLTDEDRALLQRLPAGLPLSVVRNKADLSGNRTGLSRSGERTELVLSAKTGAGVESLRDHLKESMGFQSTGEGKFMGRRRHVDALGRAARHLDEAEEQMVATRAGELVAEELRLAQQALSEITGEFTADDLLGAIFSSFCIGK